MEIRKIWQDDLSRDNILDELLLSGIPTKKHSLLPLHKIRSNILFSLFLAFVITIFYCILFAYIPYWQVQFILALLTVYNIVLMLQSWMMYKNIPRYINPMNNLKDELTKQCENITKWWKLQERISVFIYPFAIAGGFIWGAAMGAGKPIDFLLGSWKILSSLAGTIVILTPLCYFAARWLFNVYFGKHLKKLQQVLNELENA